MIKHATTSPCTRQLAALVLTVLLSGCAAQKLHDEGLRQVQQGQVASGLQTLRQASEMEPSNARYRIDYLTQRTLATQGLLERADAARNAGRLDEATQLYREATLLDAGNERALRGMQLVADQRRADVVIAQADRAIASGQLATAHDLLRQAAKNLRDNPSLAARLRVVEERVEADRAAREREQAAKSAFRRPVTLQFRDANLKMVFEALSRTSNVNIILDRDVKSDLKTTIYVKDASVEDTIDLILLQNQLEKRVLNSNTMFVYQATASKLKEYSELKVKTFQVSNIEAAHMANIIKSLLKTRDVVTDARTNTLVMRDTADAIAVAEKLVAANDAPDPEVMLEVQVLEVSTDRLSNLGIKWPDTFAIATPETVDTWGELRALRRGDLVTTPLSVALNLMLQDTDTNILASPRIRARNKEKARILVGDKVPVITNLLTPQQAGQTSVITGSIQYVEVGIKLEVEPQVYLDGDVGIKVNLEVSNIVKEVITASGQAYQIGTRSAQTSLRLRDGETQVLAGLITDEDRSTASKVPGLGQVPIAGRLFSSTNGTANKREIVLSITPRILRPQTLPEARSGEVWSGTETLVRDRPLRLEPIGAASGGSTTSPPASPGSSTAPSAEPAAGASAAAGTTRPRVVTQRRPGPPLAPPGGAPASAAPDTLPGATPAAAQSPAPDVPPGNAPPDQPQAENN